MLPEQTASRELSTGEAWRFTVHSIIHISSSRVQNLLSSETVNFSWSLRWRCAIYPQVVTALVF